MCRNGHPLFIPEKYRLRMRSLVLGSWASEDVVDRYLNSVLCRPIPFLASSSHPFAAFFCVSFCSSFCSFLFISFSVAVKGFAFLSLGSLDIGIYPGQQLEYIPNEITSSGRLFSTIFHHPCVRHDEQQPVVRVNPMFNMKTIHIYLTPVPYHRSRV